MMLWQFEENVNTKKLILFIISKNNNHWVKLRRTNYYYYKCINCRYTKEKYCAMIYVSEKRKKIRELNWIPSRKLG